MPKDVILTADGLEKLKVELAHLLTDRRPQVAARHKEDRASRDLSEHAE